MPIVASFLWNADSNGSRISTEYVGSMKFVVLDSRPPNSTEIATLKTVSVWITSLCSLSPAEGSFCSLLYSRFSEEVDQ